MPLTHDQALAVEGTCLSNYAIAEKYGLNEDDVEDALLNFNIERCAGCAWWHESCMLSDPEDNTKTGRCDQCRE